MATLQIEFNCLCLFVCDTTSNVVHVLMPDTRNHNHAGHDTEARSDSAAATGESQAGVRSAGESEAGEPSAAWRSGGEDASKDAGLPRSIQRPADASDGADRPVADGQAAEPSHAGHPAPSSGGENGSADGSHAGHPAPSSGGDDASGEPPHGEHPPEGSDGEVESEENEGGLPPHVVRLLRFDAPEGDKGQSLEGWTLELGPEKGEAVTDLTLDDAKAKIVDLGELTKAAAGQNGRKVKKELVDGQNSTIATRITLRAGRLISLDAEAVWMFGDTEVKMAHRGVWEIDGVPDDLPWKSADAGAAPPLAKLSDLGEEVDLPGHAPGDERKGYQIRIFHVTEDGLPPADIEGVLDPEAVKHHFRVFYDVLEHAQPAPEQLPEPEPSEGKTVNCGMAQAEIA